MKTTTRFYIEFQRRSDDMWVTDGLGHGYDSYKGAKS